MHEELCSGTCQAVISVSGAGRAMIVDTTTKRIGTDRERRLRIGLWEPTIHVIGRGIQHLERNPEKIWRKVVKNKKTRSEVKNITVGEILVSGQRLRS